MEILNLLQAGDILVRAQAGAKRPLLQLIAENLAFKANVPDEIVLAALLNRERLGSTAIGHGIALPHALLEELTRPAATLAVLERPVSFAAPDEQPVHVVLALIWPRARAAEFTPALSLFCRLLSRREVLEGIRCAASADEVLACLAASVGPEDRPYPAEVFASAAASDGAARSAWR